MGSGKTNKIQGHAGEQYYAAYFRKLGFTSCDISRGDGKRYDNAKIDLMHIPYNIQIKTGKHKSMNAGKELFTMESAIKSMFPEEDEVFKKPCLLIHRKHVEEGNTRLEHDDIVFMSLQQFDLYKNNGAKFEYIYLKEFKFELGSQFKCVIAVTMEDFKKEVILKEQLNVNDSK